MPPDVTWKLGLGLGYGSQAEREFSWYLKGPLKACETALRLKTHTAEAAMLFLGAEEEEEGRSESPTVTSLSTGGPRTLPSGSTFQRTSRSRPRESPEEEMGARNAAPL